MIVSCTNCNKKFEIPSEQIPENGRLLECGVCKNQWFFKKDTINSVKPESFNENISNQKDFLKEKKDKININLDINKDDFINTFENEVKDLNNTQTLPPKIKKINKIFNVIIIFVISFIAFVILIDTFKEPIAKIIPNIEFILYNLYETIIDLKLFFKDLI